MIPYGVVGAIGSRWLARGGASLARVRRLATFILAATLLLASSLPGDAMARVAKSRLKKTRHQTGIASYYGPEFNRRPTANGEIFDPRLMTAAHPTLPFGTRVRVTNLANGRRVVVRINDRGPYKRGRVLDLTRAAANKLGFTHDGLARVRIDVLSRGLDPRERMADDREPRPAAPHGRRAATRTGSPARV